jgi:hypothetical protein
VRLSGNVTTTVSRDEDGEWFDTLLAKTGGHTS